MTFPHPPALALTFYKQSKVGAPEDLYECQKVPGYDVGQGSELAPSPTCLSGGYSWGVCEDGRFLCQILRPNVWHGGIAQRASWMRTRNLLKAANWLPSRRPHPASLRELLASRWRPLLPLSPLLYLLASDRERTVPLA